MAEAAVGILNQTGKNVRTIEVTTFIAGVPTTVEMQVMSLADGAGNIIDGFANYNLQQQILIELRLLREAMETWLGAPSFGIPKTATLTQQPPSATF